MSRKAESEEAKYKVECAWCGSNIRRNSAKDSQGMCLKCYARMLGEHGHAHERQDTLRWAKGQGNER